MPETLKNVFNPTELILISAIALIAVLCTVSYLFMTNLTEARLSSVFSILMICIGYLGAKTERFIAKTNSRRTQDNTSPDGSTDNSDVVGN